VPLRIGLLTSWNTRCGIAEYSRNLTGALHRCDDVEVTVLGSRNFGERSIAPYENGAVAVFDIQPWHPEWLSEIDVERILELELDVLLVEYSNLFYRRSRLVQLLREFPGVTAVTYHDQCVSGAFPYRLPDLLYTHREGVGVGPTRLIPQGVDLRAPVVKTFGLGKSRTDIIGAVCDANGWDFRHSFGEDRWLDGDELFEWLRDCDAIVLWYDEDPTAGSSAAAPLAIGTRRPVIVNDVEWFRELPDRASNLRKIATPEQLESELLELFANPFAEERTWDRVAETLVADFREALDHPRPLHRQRLRSRVFVELDFKPYSLRKRRLLGAVKRSR